VAEDVPLVGDVVGADHLWRVSRDESVEVVAVAAGPERRDDLLVVGGVSLPTTWPRSLTALPNAQAAPPTGGRSVILPSCHKNPWKSLWCGGAR